VHRLTLIFNSSDIMSKLREPLLCSEDAKFLNMNHMHMLELYRCVQVLKFLFI